MKRCGSRMIWGTALVLILGTLTTVETLAQVTATLAVDNAHIVCWGSATAITSCDPMPPSFHGAYAGGPQPDTHTIPAISSDYIYVVAWSDDKVAQGFLGEFSGNLGTAYSAINNSSPWQVCPASPLVSEDRDISDQPSNTIDAPTTPPTIAQLNTRLASCTWQSVAIGPTNGSPSSPWGMKAGISTNAQWIWFNSNQPACQGSSAPFVPGCNHQEYLIFRIPASLILLEEQPCVSPPLGLVAWWAMNEQAGANIVDDIAGEVNNSGTPTPGPINSLPPGGGPVPVAGMVNGALYFIGEGGYIQVPHHSEIDFGIGSFSIDAWVRAVQVNTFSPIVDKFDWPTGFRFNLVQNPPGTARLQLHMNSSTFTSTGSFTANANPLQNAGNWVHVAVTVDRVAGIGTFYINGAPAGTFSPPPGSISNTAPLMIGFMFVPVAVGEVAIDELELFNRALTAQEIQAIYEAGSAGKCPPSQAVDLVVEKRIANLPWQVGGTGEFSILVSNNGPSAVSTGTTITIVDSIPHGMNYTGFSGQGWSCAPLPPASSVPAPGPVVVKCTYTLTSSLSANQTLPLLTLTVQPTAPGGFENCVSVEAAVSDPNLSNNQKCREGEIIGGAGTEVCILKFEDLDGDGQRDPIEQGLGGWTFNVTPSNISPAPPLVTYPDGRVCFKVINPGTYTIIEQVQPGWTLTTPNPQTVTVQAGQSITVAFGNKQTCVQPPSHLIAWWPLDETAGPTAFDIVDGHHGTFQNNPSPAVGVVGGAWNFTNGFVEVPNHPDFDFSAGEMTIDAWIQFQAPAGYNPNDPDEIVWKRTGGPQNTGFSFQLSGAANSLGQLQFAASSNGNLVVTVTGGPNLRDGAWHHVAVTLKSGGSAILYVDGVQVASALAAAFANLTNPEPLRIGMPSAAWFPQTSFRGLIDEVEIFNRALSEQEIQAIHKAGPNGKCKQQPPPLPPPVGFAVCAAGPDNTIDDLEMLSIIDAWIKQQRYQTCGVPTDIDVLQALDTWIKAGTRSEAAAFAPLQVRMIALSQNPVRTSAAQFVIEGNGILQTSVRVFTLNGREVFSQTNRGNIVSFAKAGELPNGVYLYVVRVQGYDGREYVSEVRKLVILR